MAHPRNLIVAEEDSQATIVEDYVSLRRGRVVLQRRSPKWSRASTRCFATT